MRAKHLLLTIMIAFPSAAFGVRPFVTDDARIVDYGQLEFENWFEAVRANGETAPAPGFNVMGGATVTDWLEILGGLGIGRDPDGDFTVGNATLTGKVLLRKAELDGGPGFAFSVANTFDNGKGSMSEEGTVRNIIGMTTWRLDDDNLFVHLNLGLRRDSAEGSSSTRVYWGVGGDLAIYGDKIRLVAEAFGGDPLVPNAPSYAVQTGFRYMYSDYTQFDITFGFDPKESDDGRRLNSFERTAQLGIRFLIDTFTRGGAPGSPDGAPGLF